MYFLKKAWPFVVAAIVVSIGAFVLGRVNKPEPSVVTIYKEVAPTPESNEAQRSTAEVAGHVPTPPESMAGTGHDRRTPIELRGTEGEAVPSDAEGNTKGSVVAEGTTPRNTKGVVPPERMGVFQHPKHLSFLSYLKKSGRTYPSSNPLNTKRCLNNLEKSHTRRSKMVTNIFNLDMNPIISKGDFYDKRESFFATYGSSCSKCSFHTA